MTLVPVSISSNMRVLVPMYSRPGSAFWDQMVSASANSTVDYSVVINPGSGPGAFSEDVYTNGMVDLLDAGVEVLCYVPTGFGVTNVSDVTSDMDLYETFYPGLCGGYFFDEGPGTENNTWKYTEYYEHAQLVSGPGSTVVVNPGIQPHDSLYDIGDRYSLDNPGMGGQVVITSFENKFEAFYDGTDELTSKSIPFPPRYIKDRYMHSILVYDAFFSDIKDFLDWVVYQLYCANWGYVYFTDDNFGSDGNPWDALPGYFPFLLDSVSKVDDSFLECETWAPTPSPTMDILPTLPPTLSPTLSPIPYPSDNDDNMVSGSPGHFCYRIWYLFWFIVVGLGFSEVLLFEP